MITDKIDGKTYVIHALKGYEEHAERIKHLFKQHNLSFEFVTEGDPSNFTDELLYKYFSKDIRSRMSDGSISCALNHILAYERMVKDDVPYALFFEDDPYFLGNFKKKLNRLHAEIEALEPGFIISLENTRLTFPSFWTTERGKYLYPAKVSRMAGAYFMDLQAAKNTLDYLQENKCSLAIDWFHIELIEEGVLRMYWAHPPLVEQGSHNGLMTGSISTRPKSLKRRIKWLVNKTYKKYFRRLFPQRRIIKE